jgi:hypothetical protein
VQIADVLDKEEDEDEERLRRLDDHSDGEDDDDAESMYNKHKSAQIALADLEEVRNEYILRVHAHITF